MDTAYTSSKNKQLYNTENGKIVKIQPDTDGSWFKQNKTVSDDMNTVTSYSCATCQSCVNAFAGASVPLVIH